MMIEKNIPAPQKPAEVLNAMEVGDSIFEIGRSVSDSRIYMVARQMPRRNGKKFSARTEENGLRIWRIA